MATRVLLADDHAIVCEGLRSLLQKEPDVEVVGTAGTGRDAVQMARKLAPDVAILDITMPDMNGIEAARQIRTQTPRTKVIALSMHADRRFAAEMLKAGAQGYLLKECAFEELLNAVRAVVAGHTYLSPRVSDVVVKDYVSEQSPEGVRRTTSLTSREREVLQLLAEGHSTKQISLLLHVSTSTVDTHRQHIMNKLGLHSIAGLTKYAIREGLTSEEN